MEQHLITLLLLHTEAQSQTPTPGFITYTSVYSFFFLTVLIILCVLFKYQNKAISDRIKETKDLEDKISFLANIVHELRTPLLLIYSPVKELLKKRYLDHKDYKQIMGIYNQVNNMTSMINLILDSSRNKIRKEDIVPETIELNSWINGIINDYEILCSYEERHIVFLPDPKISSTVIDRNIIETSLSNLLNNAMKYSPKGTEIIVSTQQTGEMISITVRDKGRGFFCDAEDLFRKNYREKPDDSVPGYGLGLTYIRFLLELAEGTITAFHNDDGIGSSFCMTFPVNLRK